ncbi:MAG: hypothetical protein HON53_04615 [Planctomycetaceae bacterium]|nr:hypothetical protein [Planctomycetaceae bacterium]MBT6496039.1 hypothetical protein [Planctomycetaceae bacterium]
MTMSMQSRSQMLYRRMSVLLIAVIGAGILLVGQCPVRAQDDPPAIRYRRDLTYASIERSLFKSVNVYNSGWREANASLKLRALEHKLKRQWLNVEMRAFHRLAGVIDSELETIVAARKDLVTSSLDAVRFSNGDNWPVRRSAFIKMLRQVGHSDQAREMLRQQADPLPAYNFTNHKYLRLVDADGSLSPPPKTMTDRSHEGRGIELFRSFRDEWQQAATALKQDRLVGSEQTERMRSLLSELDDARDTIRGKPSVASTTYLEQAGLLVATIEQTEGRMEMGEFLRNKGHGFQGETVGEMVRHILEHDLVVIPGTEAHLAMGTVTNALVKVAKAEADVLTARIEVLKAQSPSHNAALRQKLIPPHLQEFSGKNAGMDSPAFSKLPKAPAKEKADSQ